MKKGKLSGYLSEKGVYHEAGDSQAQMVRALKEKGIAVPKGAESKKTKK